MYKNPPNKDIIQINAFDELKKMNVDAVVVIVCGLLAPLLTYKPFDWFQL